MAFSPILNTEIINGAPADQALFTKVKVNFDDHEMRLVAEEVDLDVIRAYQIIIDDIDNLYTGGDIEVALAEVMTKVNANKVSSDASLLSHSTRITTLETESERDNTTLSFLGICSINKNKFKDLLTATGAGTLTYSSSSVNKTGIGALTSTANAETFTYNNFMPVNSMLGIAGALTVSAPVGSTVEYGFRCFDANQVFISNKSLSSFAGTNAFVTGQGHLKNEGVALDQFPVNTRFVKPYITWSGNTGTIIIDFVSAFPLLFSQYSLYAE